MNLYDIFTFGKYKGLSLKEVYQGLDKLNKDLVKKYLTYNIESEIQYINSTVSISEFSFSSENNLENETKTLNVKDRSESKPLVEIISILIEDDYISTCPIIINTKIDYSNIEYLFRNRNSLIDRNTGYLSLEDYNMKIYSTVKNTSKITDGDPQYIEWCILNKERFYVDIEDIIELQGLEVYKFIGIDLSPMDFPEGVYDYKHKMKSLKLSFSKKIIDINEKKFKDYDIGTEERDLTANRSSYQKYNGYNGWSDDVIDDAFEGDPENTWNVD